MNSTTAIFRIGPVALEFGPAVQEDLSDAPTSKLLIGFGLSKQLRVNFFESGQAWRNSSILRDVSNSRETSR